MAHYVEDLQSQAAAAIDAMRVAALAARRIHAHAELMRHMRMTAAKVKDKPRAEAIEAVVAEWMGAWHLSRSDWPHVAKEMEAFTDAFYDYAHVGDDANDRRVRDTAAALDAALAREGASIADQMAWRSMCAHGWWEAVSPTPATLPGRTARPTIPAPVEGRPFWEAGCAEQCR